MIIYLDMDEVVADWFGHVSKLLNKTWPNNLVRIPLEDWAVLLKHQRVYRDLPLKEGAHDLVRWCQTYVSKNPDCELRFLSAIPSGNDMPWAVQDKVWWAHHYFPGIPVFIGPYSKDKYQHCAPDDILIDDREENILAWIAAGGRAHMYKSWSECKPWLENTLGCPTTI